MPTFRTDEVLWYNVGVWGELGYAVPNFGDNVATLNNNIAHLVQIVGRNLFAVMHHSDVDLRTPPSINTLTRVHKLIVRARQILSGRALAPATPRMEPTHSTPAQEVFLIYPVPFFKVRNAYLKEWAALILNSLGEAMQHTENRVEYEISTAFSGTIGQYLQRVYVRMSTELFNVPLAEAAKPDFTLSEAQLQAYDPTKWFTSTELVDTVPPLDRIPTEDDLDIATLAAGIPANMLLGLSTYPRGNPPSLGQTGPGGATSANVGAALPTGSFAPPPSP